MNTPTKESLELDIANAVCRYHRDQQGKAPGKIRASLHGNMIYVLCTDVYTPNEHQLATTEEGRSLIKSARRELRSLTRSNAHAAIERVVGCPVVRSYWDLDSRVGEQLEAYVLSEDLEKRYL